MKLAISQINLHHSKTPTAEINRLLANLQTNLCLIQEPWLIKNHVSGVSLKNHHCWYDGSGGKVRACIVIHKEFQSSFLPQFSGPDISAIIVNLSINSVPKKIVFCSLYLPYDADPVNRFQELYKLHSFCVNNNYELVLGCDANAHHVIWGSTDINSRGAALAEFLLASNLEILNKGNAPTFSNSIREEVIDISLASFTLIDFITNWHVSSAVLASDHKCIQFDLHTDHIETKFYRNKKKTNWQNYNRCMEEKISDWNPTITSLLEIESSVSYLQDSMIDSFESSCPLKAFKYKESKIWWNRELLQSRKEVRKCWNKMRAARLHNDSDAVQLYNAEYKLLIKCHKKLIRDSIKNAWKKHCESIDTLNEASRLQKSLINDNNYKLGFIERVDGSFTTSELETAQRLVEVHFPGSVISDHIQLSSHSQNSSSTPDWNFANKVINHIKVEWAIKQSPPFKSSGPDGIFPALVQNILGSILHILSNIFKACIAQSYVPKAWRAVNVVFIPKIGKPSYSSAKSFRPISLAPFLLKCLERLIENFINNEYLSSCPLSPNLHAYRSGKSTETALHHLICRVEKAFNHKAYALTSFLDIESAFDNTTFESIAAAASNFGISSIIIDWIINMLKCRSIKVTVGEASAYAKVVKGCPQGGVLSPLLWTLVIDSLIKKLNEQGLYALSYADDVAIIIIGFYPNVVFNLMQNALNIVQNWCIEQQLSVNSDKTYAIMFTKNRKSVLETLTIFGKEVKFVKEFKFLGVIIDYKLSWSSHVENRLRKSMMSLWQLRRTYGRSWGLSPKILFWIYTSIVRAYFCYAAIVWWPRCEVLTVKRHLDHLQRTALMGITGAFKTTPTSALEVLLNITPLDLFVKFVAQKTAYRLICINQWVSTGIIDGHRFIINDFMNIDSNTLAYFPQDSLASTYVLEKNYVVFFPVREYWSSNLHNELISNHIVWFTDGSLCNGLAGAGAYLMNFDYEMSISLGKYASVFQSEIFAIIIAVTFCLDMEWTDKSIIICSDSQAALKSLDKFLVNSRLVNECKSLLNSLGAHNRVKLLWVPGHFGVEGNEKADFLARKGSSLELIGPEPALGISKSCVISRLSSNISIHHWKRWVDSSTCRQTKEFSMNLDKKRQHYLLSLNKSSIKIITALITGHCGLNYHLSKIGIAANSICDACLEDDETAIHFLCECPAFAWIRNRVFGTHFVNPRHISTKELGLIIKFVNISRRLMLP